MLQRVKWNDEVYKDKDGVEADNGCVLVWEGETKERSFGEIFVKQCPTESFARDYFKKLSVEHYWDQAYSGAVLEATEDF
jgi:U4/U6 small nuclear ribonucleoprotein PRP3